MIIILILISILLLSIVGLICGSIDTDEVYTYFYLEDQTTENYDDYKCGYKIKDWKKLGLKESECYKVKQVTTKKHSFNFFYDEDLCGWSAGVGGLFLVALCICGGICIHEHSSWGIESKEIAITEHITQLETEKTNLMTYYEESINKDIDISSTNLPAKINEHNAEVREFVVDIKNRQIYIKNPWTSWFVNDAYRTVDLDRLTATYINLK